MVGQQQAVRLPGRQRPAKGGTPCNSQNGTSSKPPPSAQLLLEH